MSCVVLVSCTHSEEKVRVHTALIEPTTFCVAPILNFSDELTLDPIKLADLLASELTYVDGATVLPVSRVVAALAARGRTQIESTEDALAIAEAVGADAIIVTGITEYDAYTPTIGVAMQIYSVRGRSRREWIRRRWPGGRGRHRWSAIWMIRVGPRARFRLFTTRIMRMWLTR